MDDEKRMNILANISEDMAQLFDHEFLKLGREKFYSDTFEVPEWSWRYTSDRPTDAFDYAFNRSHGTFKRNCMPSWASQKALFDVFRDEIERDYQTWLGANPEEDGENERD